MPKQASTTSSPALQTFLKGDIDSAIRLQSESVKREMASGKDAFQGRKLLGHFLYSARRFADAIEALRPLQELRPSDPEIPENIGVLLLQVGDQKGAIRYLDEAFALNPSNPNICDALAHCHGRLGNRKATQKWGRKSLEMKDAGATLPDAPRWPIPDSPPPPFSDEDPSANIISFSLWGSDSRYLDGAVANARLCPELYPGWTCRFYSDDSVPSPILDELRDLGAEIIDRPRPASFSEGLFWRFEVLGDEKVERFLVRDCDSVINSQERAAVEQWLASDRWFHAMRDFYTHTELLLAGMWGGVQGILPPLAELRTSFHPTTVPTRTFDQAFLRACAWPTVRESVLIHDSVYTGCLGSIPFPEIGRLPPGQHVGQNAAVRAPAKAADSSRPSGPGKCRFLVLATDEESREAIVSRLQAGLHCGVLNDLEGTLDRLADAIQQAGIRREEQQACRLELIRKLLDSTARSGSSPEAAHCGTSLAPLSAAALEIARNLEDLSILIAIGDLGESCSPAKSGKSMVALIEQATRELSGRLKLIKVSELEEAGSGMDHIDETANFLGD